MNILQKVLIKVVFWNMYHIYIYIVLKICDFVTIILWSVFIYMIMCVFYKHVYFIYIFYELFLMFCVCTYVNLLLKYMPFCKNYFVNYIHLNSSYTWCMQFMSKVQSKNTFFEVWFNYTLLLTFCIFMSLLHGVFY